MYSVSPRARGWSSVSEASARNRGKSLRRKRGRLTRGNPRPGSGGGLRVWRGSTARTRSEAAPRDPREPRCDDEQPEMGEVPERDALIVARGRREVQEIARTPSGGETASRSPASGPSGDAPRSQSAWALVNAQGVAEGRVEIERVEDRPRPATAAAGASRSSERGSRPRQSSTTSAGTSASPRRRVPVARPPSTPAVTAFRVSRPESDPAARARKRPLGSTAP